MAASACKNIDKLQSEGRSAALIVATEIAFKHLTNKAYSCQYKIRTAFYILKQPHTKAKLLKFEPKFAGVLAYKALKVTIRFKGVVQTYLTPVPLASFKLSTQQVLLTGCLGSPFTQYTVIASASPANLYIECWHPEHLLLHAL